MKYIDLRSDTVTQPTPAMREAMYRAMVGDDVYRDDPTTNHLEERAAEILGKEAALLVASGTMGNQLGIMSQTRRGDEIIVGAECHIVVHEAGAPAVLAGVNMRTLPFANMQPCPDAIGRAIRSDDIHEPPTALICLENALANGRVVPIDTMDRIYRLAQSRGLPVHLDGARLFNAAVALGVDAREITRRADTVSCCLSKGLCAPVGAIFAGPRAVVERARRYRKMLGGGMRQTGFLAAAGLLALEEMPARLHIDHENARYMAGLLAGLPGVTVDLSTVQINMVFFKVAADRARLEGLPAAMLARGIKINGLDGGLFRWVTSNDTPREDIEKAVATLAELLA